MESNCKGYELINKLKDIEDIQKKEIISIVNKDNGFIINYRTFFGKDKCIYIDLKKEKEFYIF
jgi:hypothetical protein